MGIFGGGAKPEEEFMGPFGGGAKPEEESMGLISVFKGTGGK